MKRRSHRALKTALAFLFALASSPAYAAISIEFAQPAANSTYIVGQPISYAGSVIIQNGDRFPNRINVSLVHWNGSNPPYGTGTIVASVEASFLTDWIYSPDDPLLWTHAMKTWGGPSPSDLIAVQNAALDTTQYHLRAVPFWKGSIPFVNPGTTVTYSKSIALGAISSNP